MVGFGSLGCEWVKQTYRYGQLCCGCRGWPRNMCSLVHFVWLLDPVWLVFVHYCVLFWLRLTNGCIFLISVRWISLRVGRKHTFVQNCDYSKRLKRRKISCSFRLTYTCYYLGYGASFGPIQFTSSVNAFPDRYFSFVSLVHRSVGYLGHKLLCDRTDESTIGSMHIVKIV